MDPQSPESAVDECIKGWESMVATLESGDATKIKEETEAFDDKMTTCHMSFAVVKPKDISPELVEKTIKLIMSILVNDKLVVDKPELFRLNGAALALFAVLEEMVGTPTEVFEGALIRTVALVASLSTVPFSRGPHHDEDFDDEDSDDEAPPKKVKAPHHHKPGETCTGHSDDEEHDDSLAETWNSCTNILLACFDNTSKKHLIAKYGPQLVPLLTNMILNSEDPELAMEQSDLLSLLILLGLPKNEVLEWEAIDNHDLENLIGEEEEIGVGPDHGKLIGDEEADPHFYDAYPFYELNIEPATVATLIQKALVISGAQMVSEDVCPASIIAAFLLVLRKFPSEVTNPIIKQILDKIVELLKETNQSETPLAKIPLFNILGHVFAFATVDNLKPHWNDLFNMIENCRATEQANLKPKPAPGKRGRGRGGRGGRGRGGGGQEKQEVDPEKAMEFRLLSKCLAFALGKLCSKGGEHLISNSQKFFQITESAFKNRELLFDYLTALKAVLSLPETEKLPAYATAKNTCLQKMTHHFQLDYDNLFDQYSSPKSKTKSVERLTQIGTARSQPVGGVMYFPEYLEKVVNALLNTLKKDGAVIGPTIVMSLLKVFIANVDNEFIATKVPEYIAALQPFLKTPEDEPEDQDQAEMEHFLRYSALDAIEVLLARKQFSATLFNAVLPLVPSLTTLVKSTSDEVKKMDEITQKFIAASLGASNAADEEEPPELVDIQAALPSSEAAPALQPFNFGAPSTGTALPAFNFGGNASALPKFDFGAAPAATPAAPATEAAAPAATPAAEGAAPAFNFGANTALPKFDFGAAAAPATTGAPTGTFSFTPVAGGSGLDFPKFDFAAAAADAAKQPGSGEKPARGGRGRGGRGRGRGARAASSSDESSEEDIPRGRGGRGRGRGRGAMMVPSSEDESSEMEDSMDMDSEEDSGDEESPDAVTCLATVDVVLSLLQVATPEQRAQLKELEDEMGNVLTILSECTRLYSDVRDRKAKFEKLKK